MGYFYSIIIPAWNVEKYIEKCIRSCVNFNNREFEIIIINDGSTDSTLEVINQKFGDNDNIRVITTANRGLSEARNEGIRQSQGEYLIFLDADDWLQQDMEDFLKNKDKIASCDVFYFGAQKVSDENNGILSKSLYPIKTDDVLNGKDVIKVGKKYYIPVEAWRGVYRKQFLIDKKICFVSGILYEDVAFWFSFIKNAGKLRYTNDVFYNYRVREKSIMNSNSGFQNVKSVFIIAELLLTETNDKDYLEVAAKKIVESVLVCERKISTKNLNEFDNFKEQILSEKRKLIKLINKTYASDNSNELKIKNKLISDITGFLGIYDADLIKEIIELRELVVLYLKELMRAWSLHDNKVNIGVYGCGRNSDIILDTYNQLIGSVNNSFYYIDSKLKSKEKRHFDHWIVNYKDICKYKIEKVIICSHLYEEEMFNNLEHEENLKEIFTVYNEDTFSLDGLISGNYFEIYRVLEKTKHQKRFILLQTPQYSNIGDHLIVKGEREYLNHYFPECAVVEITNDEYAQYKVRIKQEIKKDDILVITGGGFLGSLWTDGVYDEVIDIIEGYPDNMVWIMPQSIYFQHNEKGERYDAITRRIFMRDKIKVCAREKYTYQYFKNIGLKEDTLILCPDMALYSKADINFKKKRQGCALFFRTDKEAVLSEEKKQQIKQQIQKIGMSIKETSMLYDTPVIKSARKAVIAEKIREMSEYELVVTDRLHCMIMCVITGTPCITFNNVSKKVQGVYEWINELDYIQFVNSIEEFIDAINNVNLQTEIPDERLQLNEAWEDIYNFLTQ